MWSQIQKESDYNLDILSTSDKVFLFIITVSSTISSVFSLIL